jgi:hypothetical protein
MSPEIYPTIDVPASLIEALRTFPRQRDVEHCGRKMTVSPFDLYAECPHCGSRLKLRAFSAGYGVEDIFDAVFEWMNRPEARELARRRQEALANDSDE